SHGYRLHLSDSPVRDRHPRCARGRYREHVPRRPVQSATREPPDAVARPLAGHRSGADRAGHAAGRTRLIRMVRLTRLYARGCDRRETSLGSGVRVPRHDLRFAAFGTVDEANAAIGIARLHADGEADVMLERIQNDLFDLGADLCTRDDGPRAEG